MGKQASGDGRRSGRGGTRKGLTQREHETRLTALFSTLLSDLDNVHSDEPATVFAIERLRERMRKRAPYVRPGLEAKAIDDFLRVNAEVTMFDASSMDSQILGEARDFVYFVLNKHARKLDPEGPPDVCFNLLFVEENWRFGPKASYEVDGVGTVEKIDQAMTCTSRAEPSLRRIRMANPYFCDFDTADHGGLVRVEGSKLTTVLKNEDAVRTIATEPSGNMALQLGGGLFIEEALIGIGLNIHNQQPKNQRLAQKGSCDGEVATLDLKGASDRKSRQMISRVWPEEWVHFFENTRSPITKIGGRSVQLGMMSTMGNGFTFPMMTLTILAIIYAVRRLNGGPRRWIDWRQTAVFGDDIIVPVHEVPGVISALENFGFLVNQEKSFSCGPFRESCGGDYYEGVDVTPFYVKSLASPAAVYVAINQVIDWAARFELPLVRTIRLLRSWLQKVFLVPEWSQPTAGIRTAQCPKKYKMLRTVPVVREYKGRFLMPLVCGGFLASKADSDGVTYMPHESDYVRYATGEAWLPRGYQDGFDPLLGGHRTSSYRSLLVAITN